MKKKERQFQLPPEGVYTAGWIPYGYKYDPDATEMVVIDEDVADAVRFLFQEYIKGNSVTEIVQQLEKQGFPTPAKRKEQLGGTPRNGRNPDVEHFNPTAFNQAFFHPIYAGDLIHSGRIWDAVYYYAEVPAPEGIELPQIETDHHEALICRADMKRACERYLKDREERNAKLAARPKRSKKSVPEVLPDFSLTSVLRCGECGRSMNEVQMSIGGQPCTAYLCAGLSLQQPSKCTNRFYRQSELTAILYPLIEAERRQAAKMMLQVCDERKNQQYQRIENHLQRQIDQAVDAVRKNMAETRRLKMQYQSGSLSEEEYLACFKRLKEEDDTYNNQVMDALVQIREFRDICNPQNPWLALYASLPERDFLADANGQLQSVIEQITVFPDRPPKIQLAKMQEKEALLTAMSRPIRKRKTVPSESEDTP